MRGNIGVEFDHMNLETKRFLLNKQCVTTLLDQYVSKCAKPSTLFSFVRKLSSLLPNCTLVDISKVTARQRMIKSKEEIEVESLFFPHNQTKLLLKTHSPFYNVKLPTCHCCKSQDAIKVIKLGAATADIGGWACRCA